MKIGLIDVDSHNFPNLCLMKLSAYHKQQGDDVEWWNGFLHYDRVYQSKIFDETYTPDNDFVIDADEIIKGGTGYDLKNRLPDDVEHTCPDYSLYGIEDTAYGFLTRGCPRQCPFCITSKKDGRRSRKVADLREFWSDQTTIELLDQNILACPDREDLLLQLAESNARVNFTQGLDARLLTKDIIGITNRIKLNDFMFAWDRMTDERPVMEGLNLWSTYTKRKYHGKLAGVFVLTNYDTTHEEDLYRVKKLKNMKFDPYVMIYDKGSAPKKTIRLQRYVNNKYVFNACTWEEYVKTKNVYEEEE